MNTASWWGALDSVGFQTMRALLSVLWQSSILLGAVAGLTYVLRRRRASVRQALWAGALLAAPVLPLLAWVGSNLGTPQAQIPVMPTYSVFAERRMSVAPPAEFPEMPPVETTFESPVAVPQVGQEEDFTLTDYPWALALLGYISGLVLFLGLIVVGRFHLGRWVRTGVIVTDPRVLEAFRVAREQVGCSGDCVIVESDRVPAPLTLGTFRPVVLLPRGFARRLSPADLKGVALHEMAHVKRHDPLLLALASLVRAVFFFHPLVWLACRQVSRLSEQAADDAVLDATGEPIAYAKMLARLAEDLRRRSFTTELAAGILLSKGAFLRRVEAILSDRRDQIRRLSRWALVCTVLAALISLALAAALPLGEKQHTHKEAGSPSGVVGDSVETEVPPPSAQPSVHPVRGKITGTVLNAVTGKPISGAYVAVDSTGDAGGANLERFKAQALYVTAETASDGTFVLEGVAFHEGHPFMVTHKGFVRYTETVPVRPAEPTARLNILLQPAGKIVGTIANEGGEGRAGVTARLAAADGRLFWPDRGDWPGYPFRTVQTDNQGRFFFDQLDAGTFSVDAMKPERLGGATYIGGVVGIEVALGKTTEVEVAPVRSTSSIVASMLERSEGKVVYVMVLSRDVGPLTWRGGPYHPEDPRVGRVFGASLALTAVDSEGQARFSDFPAGRYAVYLVVFAGELPGRVAGVFIGGDVVALQLDQEVEIRIGKPEPTEGKVSPDALRGLDHPARFPAGEHSLEHLCELMSDASQNRASFRADPTLARQKVTMPPEEMALWEALETICGHRGWRVAIEAETVRIAPFENVRLVPPVRQRPEAGRSLSIGGEAPELVLEEGADRDINLGEIFERIRRRQARVKTVRYTWTSKKVVPKGSMTVADPATGLPVPSDLPTEDTEIETAYTVVIEGQKFRCDEEGLVWHEGEGTGKFVPMGDTLVLGADGVERNLYRFQDGGTGGLIGPLRHATARVWYQAVLQAYRLLDPVLGRIKPEEVRFVGRAELRGHPCLIIEKRREMVDQWWLAEDMDYCVLRWEIRRGTGEVLVRVDMEHEPDEQIGWRLTSWSLTMWTGAHGEAITATNVPTEIRLNEPIDPKAFDITFPPGTHVGDWLRGVVCVVGDESETYPAEPVEDDMSFEERVLRVKLKSRRLSFYFTDAPLGDVLDFVRVAARINIVVDQRVLAERDDLRVTLSLRQGQAELAEALDIISDALGLTWTIRDNAVHIAPANEKPRVAAQVGRPAPELVLGAITHMERTHRGIIVGWVELVASDVTPELWSRIATSKSYDEFNAHLRPVYPTREANVQVTLRGKSTRASTLTDSSGGFIFAHLPPGVYELSVQIPTPPAWAGAEPTVTATAQVSVAEDGKSSPVHLTLSPPTVASMSNLVSIKGRIMDANGAPIGGAAVTGKQVFNQSHDVAYEEDYPTKEISTVSDADGSYELNGFDPSDLFRTACYLAGVANELALERVDVRVQADGYVQNEANAPRVPLVTEVLRGPARSLCNAMLQMPKAAGFPQPPTPSANGEEQKATGVPFPDSKGSIITDINITLERVRTGSNPSSSTGGPSAERRGSRALGREDVEALLKAVRGAMRPAENMQVKWRYETVTPMGLSLAPMDNLPHELPAVRTEYVATILGDRSRIESRKQMYRTRETEEPYAIRSIVEVFDGTRQRRLERLLKGSGTPLRGYEELQDTNTSLLASALFDCVLPFHDAELLNAYSFSLEPGDVAGTYVLNAAPPLPDEQRTKRYRLTIDGNRGFHIIKTECLRPGRDFNKSHNYWGISDGTKYYEIDVALKEFQDGIWFPFERTRTDYSFGREAVRYKVSVTEVTFNVQVPDDTFQLEFPPGTKVWDRAREDWFIVLEEPPKPAVVAEMGKVAPELILEKEADVSPTKLTGKPVVLAKREMLFAVEAARSRMNDLSVSYSFDAIKAPDDPNFWGARLHRAVVVKGAKTYIDFRYGPAAEYGKDLFRREVAFNGDRSTIHEVTRGVAWVQTKRERETETNGCGFFDLMLLNPPRAHGYGRDDGSLLSLLRSDLSLLRENTEPVNGHPCYVLDVTHPSLGKTHMTVWLDGERGFLPMKHVYYFGEDLDQIIMEFTIEEAVELEEDLWFASRGYKRVGPVPADSANPNWRMVNEMKVDGIDEGMPDIAVNTGVEDEFFDLWERVPMGTRVVDLDADAEWTGRVLKEVRPLPDVGQPAPELVLEEGAGVSLAQFRGKPVVLAFVSIYSRPCVKVLAELRALQEEKGAEALAVIAVHDRTATPEEIEQFRKDHSIAFPIVRVPEAERDGWDSATFRAYGVTALPAVVLIDSEGKVVSVGDGKNLDRKLQDVLPKSNPASPIGLNPGTTQKRDVSVAEICRAIETQMAQIEDIEVHFELAYGVVKRGANGETEFAPGLEVKGVDGEPRFVEGNFGDFDCVWKARGKEAFLRKTTGQYQVAMDAQAPGLRAQWTAWFSWNGRVGKQYSTTPERPYASGSITEKPNGNLTNTMSLPLLFVYRVWDGNDERTLDEMFRKYEPRMVSTDTKLEDRRCVVVSVVDDLGLRHKFWLDRDRAFHILRYEQSDYQGRLYSVWSDIAPKEVSPNLWYPVAALCYSPLRTSGVRYRASLVKVNQGLPDSDFEIEFPPGTYVTDERVGTKYTVMDVPTPPEARRKAEIRGPAPGLILEEGAGVTLAQFKGKPVVLAFVSIYSRPCVKVLDELKALQEEKGSDAVAVIAVHDGTATREEIEAFRTDHSIPFPIVRVPEADRDGWDSATFRAYGITALPTVVLLDTQAKMVSIGGGSSLSQDISRLLQN